jgi:hypothetical protein
MYWGALEPQSCGAAISAARSEWFDVKAKRKMPELTQRLVISFFNNSAAAKTVDVISSTLVALP